MKRIILLLIAIVSVSCNKSVKKEIPKKSTEDMILEFCKRDIHITSLTPSTIKYDSTLTIVAQVARNFKYYNKTLDEVYSSYGSKQIEDTISRKWSITLHFDYENKYGAMIRNNVEYIIKENTEYRNDSIFNEPFIILMKIDQNKIHEYLGME